jgi:hypothetical protein
MNSRLTVLVPFFCSSHAINSNTGTKVRKPACPNNVRLPNTGKLADTRTLATFSGFNWVAKLSNRRKTDTIFSIT